MVAGTKSWVALGAAVVAVAIVAAISAFNWGVLGNTGIDLNGWIALILGVVVTLAVGIGLMSLIFISSRLGYDDPPDKQP
jgi:hypothetical protein